MKKFELRKASIDVGFKNRKQIREGIVLTSDDQYPEVIKSTSTLEKAREELQKYSSSITELSGGDGKYYHVEEYYIEEVECDEDGNCVESIDVWDFSKIHIELIEKSSFNTLGVFDNFADAESAYEDYSGDDGVYFSF